MKVIKWLALLAMMGLIGASLVACGAAPSAAEEAELTIFAAASLRDVVADLALAFEHSQGTPVALNFAGSNILAQQIRAAPSADIFLSADEDWVRFLEAQGRTAARSAQAIWRNRLVVIARPDAAAAAEPWQDLKPLLAENYHNLVLADPTGVPAGRYARAYIENSDAEMWQTLASRVVPTLDVRAALQLVASDPLHVGIVYRTDVLASAAAGEDGRSGAVKILFELPHLDAVPIVYWAARIQGGGASRAGQEFMEFLVSEAAAAIIERHGFVAVSDHGE